MSVAGRGRIDTSNAVWAVTKGIREMQGVVQLRSGYKDNTLASMGSGMCVRLRVRGRCARTRVKRRGKTLHCQTRYPLGVWTSPRSSDPRPSTFFERIRSQRRSPPRLKSPASWFSLLPALRPLARLLRTRLPRLPGLLRGTLRDANVDASLQRPFDRARWDLARREVVVVDMSVG